ncbi:MAG: hypothetical protein GX339_10460 [Tissierellia bacterium]|nr:hypothetical protein [Tissierellia bacterium]
MKKLLRTLMLVFVLTLSFSTIANAADTSLVERTSLMPVDGKTSIIIPKEIRDKEFEAVMTQILNEYSICGPKYHYRAEYYPYQYKTVSGYAGNQLPGGYRFSTGGGFWYSDSGGPEVSTSVSLALPKPYDFISISVNLGQRTSSSGRFVNVPNTTDYFKLYVRKTIEVRPYAVYRARVGTNDWELYNAGAVSSPYSVDAYAVKVN